MKKTFTIYILSFLVVFTVNAHLKTANVDNNCKNISYTGMSNSKQIYTISPVQKSKLQSSVVTTPLTIQAAKMTNLTGCTLTSDYIGSATDGSSVILGDSIDFGNGEVYNKVTSNISLAWGGVIGQRTGELDLYIDNQTIPFASLRIPLPVTWNTYYIINKRFATITGKHKVKVVWDWYIANIKYITFSFDDSPELIQKKEIKIACLGNSITEGTDAGDKDNSGYVGLLQQKFGEGYQVRNYGASASFACKNTSLPYVSTKFCASALSFQPDIVTIALGTNDSQPGVVNSDGSNFKTDYSSLVDLFANLKSKPKVYVCLPPPIFPSTRWSHQPDVAANVIPILIYEIAKAKGLEVINFYAPMINHSEFYADGDKLHPLAAGHAVMANQVYNTLTGIKVLFQDGLNIQKKLAESKLLTAIVGTTPGTYSQSAKIAVSTVLDKVNAITEFDSQIQIDQLQFELYTALKTLNSSVNYSKNTLTPGDYFIKKAGTNLFWTNTGANKTDLNYTEEKPIFQTEIAGSNDQLYHISLLTNNCYKIESKSDVPAYINERAKIRRNVNTFNADWNSFNLLFNGSSYAVQTTGTASPNGFWTLKSDVVSESSILTLNAETNFIFEFVKKNTTAFQFTKESLVKVISLKESIQIFLDQQSIIYIYNEKGSLLKTVTAKRNIVIPLLNGIYIVKVKTGNSVFVEKIVID